MPRKIEIISQVDDEQGVPILHYRITKDGHEVDTIRRPLQPLLTIAEREGVSLNRLLMDIHDAAELVYTRGGKLSDLPVATDHRHEDILVVPMVVHEHDERYSRLDHEHNRYSPTGHEHPEQDLTPYLEALNDLRATVKSLQTNIAVQKTAIDLLLREQNQLSNRVAAHEHRQYLTKLPEHEHPLPEHEHPLPEHEHLQYVERANRKNSPTKMGLVDDTQGVEAWRKKRGY